MLVSFTSAVWRIHPVADRRHDRHSVVTVAFGFGDTSTGASTSDRTADNTVVDADGDDRLLGVRG